ncbi:hypothetical protein P3X46_028409 [Hevea brasiliensis]|uniref:Pectinesterase inhibitor domain-containing protein n=1 Tax=Hevea brasiliensis TaxID=3981 RepID=A0ABQ9KQA8_HEVBR|nr:uncharacterized protein LOC110665471 [Hevea brasiliensis]KAJ9146099.1 hypothetical protein P3X46_028409 [Hevea brasiliensis]
MEFPSRHFLLSAVFMIMISHLMAGNAPSKLVEDVCNQAKELGTKFADCVDGLLLDPTSATANLTTLAHISIQLGISNATDTQTYIENMLKSNPGLQKPLKSCLSWYEAIIASFKSALIELEEDVPSANYDVKMVGDYVQGCEDELARDKVQIPSVTTRDNYAKLYSNIAFVITEHL